MVVRTGNYRGFAVVSIIVLLCVPPALACADDGESGADPRGEFAQVAPVNVTLKGSGGQYSDSSFKFTIPSGSTITAASIDLEGQPVIGETETLTCDFSQPDASNHFAYKGQYAQNSPGNAAPSTFSTTQFAAYEMANIKASDNKYTVNSISTNYMWYNYQLYKFKVQSDVASKATITWEGYAGETFAGIGTCTAYIWNDTAKDWETVGTGTQTPDITFTKDFFGSEYIDADGYLYVMAFCTVGVNFYGEILNSIATDFVQAVIESHPETYPKNPSMDIGINGQPEWSLTTDRFASEVTVNNAAMRYEIQDLVKDVKTQYADVKVKFAAETEGVIRVSGLKVVYNAPPWCKGVPETFVFDEDTDGSRLLDLNVYFDDPDDKLAPALRYDVVFQEDSAKLAAAVDPDGHSLGFSAAPDWWGVLGFRVKATDKGGLSRESNTFKVTVRSVNDPPVIAPIGDRVATQDVPWSLQASATDADVQLDPMEQILFRDNTSLFDIDPDTGNAAFTPKQDQVGTYFIQITATDNSEAVATANFTLEIKDAEDPPLLLVVPDLNATVGQPFSYTPVADDPDLPYGDTLTFSDDSPLFVINAATGLISFTPSMNDIGRYQVIITVNDSRGGSASRMLNLTVLNTAGTLNRPPAIEPIPNQTVNEGAPFEYTVKASDPDVGTGDLLTFNDNSPLFDIGSGGRISFTPKRGQSGVYDVNITVRDSEGLSASTGFRLTVVKVNRPPVIHSVLPANGTKVKPGERVQFSVNASDPDGDTLSVAWKYQNALLGYATAVTTSFNTTGYQVLTIVVSDGQSQATAEVTVQVAKPAKTPSPTSGGEPPWALIMALVLVILCIVGAIVMLSRRKR